MGDGTTAIAASALSRKWVGFEINPRYIKNAEQRIKRPSLKVKKESTDKKPLTLWD